MSGPVDADLLTPPDDAIVYAAVEDYARAVRKSLGPRVKGVYLFGSRARGDHTLQSDADVAVVLADGDWRNWPETKRLIEIAYDIIVATGADIQPWVVRESEWMDPGDQADAALFAAMRRDGRPIRS